jgi:hypothetical protein
VLSLQVLAHKDRDTIYEYLRDEWSSGFTLWQDAPKSNTYGSIAALTTGVPGALSYGPFLGPPPPGARYAQLKHSSSTPAVGPGYDSVFACAEAPNAYSEEDLSFKVDPNTEGCYPATLVVNAMFHHSYDKLEVVSQALMLFSSLLSLCTNR